MTNIAKYSQPNFLKKNYKCFLDKIIRTIAVSLLSKEKLGGLVARDKKVNIIFKPANTSLLVSSTS